VSATGERPLHVASLSNVNRLCAYWSGPPVGVVDRFESYATYCVMLVAGM
jgi:hypothetical protein